MKQMKYLILPISLFISGCSYLPFFQNDEPVVPIEIKTIQERPPMWHPPLPIEMNMLDVEFEILTPELMKEYLKLVDEGKAPPIPYYALTTQQYQNLSLNMAEVKRYTNNILAIVKYYRDYDSKLDSDNDD